MNRYHRHKFNAVQVEYDGIKFPSKREGNRYLELKLLQKTGEVVFFLRQPMFDLPGNVKYRADFIIFWAAGFVTIEDVKGVRTKEFIRAKRQVEALYPVEILEV